MPLPASFLSNAQRFFSLYKSTHRPFSFSPSLNLTLASPLVIFLYSRSTLSRVAQAFLCRSLSVSKMNHCMVSQNVFAACEEMRSNVSVSERKDSVVCPKPRRLGLSVNDPVRPMRWHFSYQAELSDARAGTELLDIILTKGPDQVPSLVSSSPPYFSGSPPSRSANPLVHDARFGEVKLAPTASPQLTPLGLSSSPSTSASARKGCARTKFGLKPAAVRVEGFDCLDRDRQNRSIPAMA
ncbi:uncharacterized protein LOC131237665 [Magnolia sinica]|uniref:uncharacterized protein LOC131237665 n=1 Tax=Magnolia sinica TaxID=86752 RepID=UPI002658C2BE|nr:uncharacterized protein LOC131237665 [Magnolia sinica]